MASFVQEEDCPFPREVHLCTPEPNAEQKSAIDSFRASINETYAELATAHSTWLTDVTLMRFLIARKFNAEASLSLIGTALRWRESRHPEKLGEAVDWAETMGRESATGKIYNPGHDRWGRPLLVFDNTVQNTPHVDDHMRFLAWNLEFAIRQMPTNIDKYTVFIHLNNFSFFNMPPFQSSRETLLMLCDCFPERLGHCIVYLPPTIFYTFFNTIKGFIDPKTVSKLVFIVGDVADGSSNDVLMRSIIGDDWKRLTGACQQALPGCSPGYDHAKFWPTVLERVSKLPPR